MKEKIIRIAAIGDIHLGKNEFTNAMFAALEQDADALLIVGDITHRGRMDQVRECLSLLQNVSIPIVAVLGNHDYDSGTEEEIVQLLTEGGIKILTGDVVTMTLAGLKVGITGTKGHGGGFAPYRGYARGEKSTKAYMHEEEREVQRFSKGLSQLQQMKLDIRIALLHYAPYRETIIGEPPELFLFLGSSSFAGELKKHPVDLVIHGHAHHGTNRLIKTREGIFACNVAQMLHRGKYAVFSIKKASDKEQEHVRLLSS